MFETQPPRHPTLVPTQDSIAYDGLANTSQNLQCPAPFKPTPFPFIAIAYGIIYPVLAFIVLFTNSNGVAVILKMKNFTQTKQVLKKNKLNFFKFVKF